MNDSIVDILLVDDRPEDAELAIRGLKKYNVANKILWLKDGEEALEYLFAKGRYADRKMEDRPKVLLLDLKMPKVDGIEVLKEIRKDDRLKYIPVVVLTTSKEEQDIVNAYDLGVNAYLLKPVEFDNFAEVMRSLNLFWVLLNQVPFR